MANDSNENGGAFTSPPSTKNALPSDQWSFKDIRWRQVIRRQDHASMILTVVIIIAVAVVTWVVDPRERTFLIYDATISYAPTGKHGFDPTVPDWVSIIIPLLMMILTIVVGEYVTSRHEHHCVTDALAVMLYFLLDAIGSLVMALLVTQATKVSVGMLRPDFLARCQPNIPNTITIDYNNTNTDLYQCTGTDSGELKNGHLSFPSGHSTFSFNLTTYASAYLIWCWNMRRPSAPRGGNPTKEFLSDLKNVVAKVWMLLMLAVAWGISMTRIIDNQHHVSDVVAGMVLGIFIAIMFIMRAIPRYSRVLTPGCSAAAAPSSGTMMVARNRSVDQDINGAV